MKKYIKAGKGTMSQFLDEVQDRIDYLEGNNVEMATKITAEDDVYGEDDDDEPDLREQEDLIDVIDRQAYFIEIYDDDEWDEKVAELRDEGFTEDEIWEHSYQDAAFDGVIFFSDL